MLYFRLLCCLFAADASDKNGRQKNPITHAEPSAQITVFIYERDLEYTNLKNALGEEMFFKLYGEYYDSMEPIFSKSTYPLNDSIKMMDQPDEMRSTSSDVSMPQRLSPAPDKNIGISLFLA